MVPSIHRLELASPAQKQNTKAATKLGSAFSSNAQDFEMWYLSSIDKYGNMEAYWVISDWLINVLVYCSLAKRVYN